MITRTEAPARDLLALALDLDDLVEALRLATQLQPWFGTVKVGLELFSAAGPEAIVSLRDLGFGVFVDLKLHDIPTTVQKAARVLGALGVDWLTLHAAGGEQMLAAGVDGLSEGAAAAGLPEPKALAVTVLTSERQAPAALVAERVTTAVGGRCAGIVCAAADLPVARRVAPQILTVVPGIRPEGADPHDQERAATPAAARAAGADVLVIGRAVTAAPDPVAAAQAITASIGPLTPATRPGAAPRSGSAPRWPR